MYVAVANTLCQNKQTFSLNGRGVLIKKDADLLLFGRVEEISNNLNIHFLSRKMGEDRVGEFLVSDRLPLPANYSELYEKLIVLSVISAIVPRSEASRLMVHANLMSNMNTVEEFDEIIAGAHADPTSLVGSPCSSSLPPLRRFLFHPS